ncbi:MAG: transporter substrate-binding protein [Paenibacillaceae bacterium]|nr:transporter substrate-binding protein [Paenibacillaceae bacterium]
MTGQEANTILFRKLSKKENRSFLVVSISLLIVLATGCNGGAGTAQPSADNAASNVNSANSANTAKTAPSFDPNEAVSLKFGQIGGALSDDEFQNLIVAPVKKMYPNVSLELVRMTNTTQPELVATNDYPDLTYNNASGIYRDKELQIDADLMPLIKKNNIDLSKFDPSSLDFVNSASGDGKIYLLPVWTVADGTFYNKDIFDKFGVAYPKDNMTWDQVLELARKVARMDGGVQYIGVSTSSLSNMKNGLGLPIADAKAKKGLLDSDSWKLLLDSYVKMQQIPGNYNHGMNGTKLFETDRTLAMYPNFTGRVGEFEKLYTSGNPMNFDLVTYPSFGDSKYAATTNVSGITISIKTTKQDWAFRVAQVLVKEENQLAAARNGRVSALKNKEIQQQYAANLGSMKGKHVEGFFTKPTNIPGQTTKYDDLGNKRINDAVDRILSGQADVNTALREANELLNQDIASNP